MGKVFKNKIQGMGGWTKTGLVLLLTLAATVFMFEGWYLPRISNAATVTYYAKFDSTTNLGIDGTANLPSGAPSTFTGYPSKAQMGTTELGTAGRHYPTGMAQGVATVIERWYAPAYTTNAQDISNISASFALRPVNSSDTFQLNVYDYNPAGAAGNKTLVATGTTKTAITSGTTSQYAWTTGNFTISGTGRVALNHRLLVELVYTRGGTNTGVRVYYGVAGTTTSSNITVTETPVAAGDTLTAGTNTAIATSASDSSPGVVMQRLKLDSNANGDSQVILSGITLDEAGTATSIANVKIYIDTVAQATLSASAVLIGNQASWNGASTTVALSQGTTANRTVAAGTSKYLYVVFDMASGQAAKTVQSHVTAVSVASPDTGAAGLNFSSNSFTLAAGPVSTITSCSGCHGNPPIDGTARNVPVGQFQGSHNLHSATCTVCHVNNGTNLKHADGNINMAVPINNTGGAYSKGATFAVSNAAFSGGTCSGTYCHGQGAPAWGASSTAPVNGYPYSSLQCAKCHSGDQATDVTAAKPFYSTAIPQVTLNTNAKVGAHTSHLASVDNLSNTLVCADCHGSVTLTAATHMNGVTNLVWNTLATKSGVLTPTYTVATGVCANVYCHGATLTGGTAKSPVWGTTLTGCGTCHGFPPATSTHTGVTATQCIGCHPHVNAAGTGFTNATLHINGAIDASGGISSGGAPCYACHSVYNVMNSSTASFHHVLDDASPDQAPNTGTYPSSQTALACTSCHTDHNYFNSNKGANLRTAYNAAAGAINNHDFSTTAPYGLCVSCHSTAQTKGTAQTVAGTTATIAIDGSAAGYQASMHNYTTSSLFGTSKFSANCVKCHTDEQAKDKQTSSAPHEFGTHFSVQRSLLNPMGATPQAAAGADFCYRCHSRTTDVNPGGGAAKTMALKDYFGSKAMTAASEDIFSAMQRGSATVGRHNVTSYKGLHKDDETRAGIAAAKHVECTDCHDPHLAKAGNHAAGSATLAGVLTGASGVGVTTWGANWAGVTAYNPSTTTAALITATAEWQVCFKCHSGANANATTWGGTAAAAFTDLALEFNPNNASGHPIITGLNNYPNSPVPKALTAARMKAPWTNVGTQVMTCSDCHATDSTASKGPHGSSVKWMLAGTNKAWPYTTTAGTGTSTGTLFRLATYNTGDGTANGLFCLNCHTIRPATGGNSWHINADTTAGEHGGNAIMACVSCHIRVPHGGKISRLLQTTNAPARYMSNGNGATSNYTQFGPTTGTVKGSTVSSSNFNSSCSRHSGTGGEAW